ncbi:MULTISPECIES: alkyl/aryl-sulfatase [Rhodococcus]|uniref:alkyl/aryl-sulfatase n=1 Tax=Rhodococcus TaxID=1827 RepID=UPI00029B2F6A|nr:MULTISPECIES: alkyl sulfatase dimerization domain-containing protein [Rhodococcus]ATQ27801.1 alkyl/aryl-sulfatase [Rhodococcus ruber]QRE81190.1 MBL fold metallo-hydrolase [Rhodococcus ruber]WML65230.1 alkyl sulfatase dimerization domain-containing protein [Rhodococcus sp. AH-ZY2]
MSASGASETTRRNLQAAAATLPADDGQDFEDATRGFVGRSEQRTITTADGRVVWDLDAYAFLDGPAPPTAHPSLWRQSRLLTEDGLFEVVPGIYQLRGFDLSVMTVVEGDTGVIVIDPLISAETAAAALTLYRRHRGDRPVSGMIYTHSHVDHFGGVEGVLDAELVAAGTVPVVAPAGFLEHAVSENLFAGTAMSRRSGYMYGAALGKGPAGQIGAGLGQTTSAGTVTLIAPTVDITATGQELTVDGVRMVFQLTPGTEAPAETNIWFPERRALCAAENATHTLHNILTLRGAVVRDAHAWGHYLNETIGLWGDALEVVFASHHWPTWGRERALEFLAVQRDMYLYLHDQTVRMMNQGLVGAEIAERFELPPALAAAWHTHGYYGSVSHNVKAIYQRYMGWYDGNPANLWAHPPAEAARRYVDAMGGADAALAVARGAFEEGDYRWVLEVCKHLLFTDDTDQAARDLQADAMEQLAYGAENGTWRCVYLAGAKELREGIFGSPVQSSGDFLDALTVPQLFDSLAVRVDGPRAWDLQLVITWVLTDLGTTYLTELRHGVLNHRTVPEPPPDSTVFTLTRRALIGALTGQLDAAAALADGTIAVTGDPTVVARLVEVLAPVDPDFAIVTP